MKRAVQKKPKFYSHEGAFSGQIAEGYAKSSPLGQFSNNLKQLNPTPHYL
ncbi:hypothetical protein TK11N_22610 [Tetragenococcus koreensis]|uniref:Uncharacterized protein n=2 Tax=Tetragenococcus koreensis TaxID=290335 RepID=A0ABQ0YDB8_9ENTE|nr:hypothetical protein TK11N_22610 [Tetragenococcus koreensis]